jgi:nucleotide-binding universal stress UspA family protein
MSVVTKITRILIPTDFSSPSQVACHIGARLANYLKAGIVVFHALPGVDLLEEGGRATGKTQVKVLDDVRDQMRAWFETAVPAELRQFLVVEFKVKVGEPISGIAWATKRSGADLVLMATQGRSGLAHLLMGSVTEAVLRSIPVPVLALRLGQGESPLTAVHRILWATDLSPVSEGAWHYVLKLADVFAAEVILLHAVRPTKLAGVADRAREEYLVPLRRDLERRQQTVQALGLSAHQKVVVGVPAEVIVAEAEVEQADLIVMGTHGRSGLPHVLVGSVAEAVIRKAPCPVLAVRAKREGAVRKQNTDGAAA